MSDRRPSLRGAIIGYGFISERGHAPAYKALANKGAPLEIVAVVDTCAARRERARAEMPGVRIYESADALFATEDSKLDFVDISAPPSEHAPLALKALDRGLHVLCEKPLATTTDAARAMLARARRVGRVLYPCHNYRHAPVIKAVRRALDADRIGRVSMVTLQTFRSTHARGVPEFRPDWRREKRWSGGGIAMDHGSHTFYLAFDWLGAYPTAITAKMSTLGPYDTEDNLSCAISFPGATASAHLSWTAGVRKVIYTLHGERGAIRVEDDDVEVNVLTSREGEPHKWQTLRDSIPSNWMDASHVTWFESLLEDFSRAVEIGEHVGKSAEDSLRCVELITRAYQSATEGSRELPLGDAARLNRTRRPAVSVAR
ncbi:Gfo/Idh/MocA family oxidoreductase [Pendulispora rubella]|uniref:Gfo/Idh/MocA family oxidoreductase n=1 Tax=Pendulispora rubella TaxID=2741070 RepID=A0ABZ2LB38_9BACT